MFRPEATATFLIFGLFLITSQSMSEAIRVPSEYPTIQAGIDAASAGDTVLVGPGTYTGVGNRDIDFGGRDLVLLAETDATLTVIDTQGEGRGFVFQSGETNAAVIDGFTIQSANMPAYFGGGIQCIGASPTIRDCDFVGNVANRGGGMYCADAESPLVSNCSFVGNTGLNEGGGIYVDNGALTVESCSFEDNSGARGAGIYCATANVMVADCGFLSNHAANYGGGVHSKNESSLQVDDSEFVGCTAYSGAGVYSLDSGLNMNGCEFGSNAARRQGGGIFSSNNTAFGLVGCTFNGNMVVEGGGGLNDGGGGLYCYDSTPSLTDCVFSNNSVSSVNQTAMYGGGVLMELCSAVFENCMFSGNSARHRGGGLKIHGGTYALDGCRITDNFSTDSSGGGVFSTFSFITFTNCEISRNHSGYRSGGIYCGVGSTTMTACIVADNWTTHEGGGLRLNQQTFDLYDCWFVGNTAETGGAIWAAASQPSTLQGCVFAGNSATFGSVGHLVESAPGAGYSITACTMTDNATGAASSCLRLGTQATIDRTIIAFATNGAAVECIGEGSAAVSCTDIYGNAGGDWTGCIADQLGIDGNFSDDPRFCAPLAGDYALAEDSPCAPENSPVECGLIGALPVACVVPIGIADSPPVVRPLVRVVPNPIRTGGVVEWTTETRGLAVLRLYDPQGRLILARQVGTKGDGLQRIRWDELIGRKDLSSGVYFLDVEGAGTAVTPARIVVTR